MTSLHILVKQRKDTYSQNVLAAGHAELAGGAESLGAAMKPEPLTA